jgi:CDP-diacylglycerol pyrophosphatase
VSLRAEARAWLRAACLIAGLALASCARADPDALWNIVHGKCAPNEAATGQPAPCLAVDLAGGYAVLKDQRGKTQVLVIPTAKITGIESSAVLDPATPNYWRGAWAARRFVEGFAGEPIPREDLALAVNSIDGRSQNQLHIHVDCLSPEVRETLSAALPDIGPRWAPLAVSLAGHRYEAMRLAGEDLSGDPFKLLAAGDPAARADMGPETLVVAGVRFADGSPGFVLLADRANPAAGDDGSGEQVQDHSCRVLAPAG